MPDQAVKHRLLRCMLDVGDGLRARELLEAMSTGAPYSVYGAKDKDSAASSGKSGKAKKESKKGKGSGGSGEGNNSGATAEQAAASSGGGTQQLADKRSCCCYNRAFIEHISIMLEEPDASEELRDQRLAEGKALSPLVLDAVPHSATVMCACAAAYAINPYTLWVVAHHGVFKEVLSRTPVLCDKEVLPYVPAGTLEDALVFYEGRNL